MVNRIPIGLAAVFFKYSGSLVHKGQPGQLGEPGPACWAFPNVLLSLFYRSAHSYCHVIPKAAGCWWADLQSKARRCYPVRLQSRYTNHKPLGLCWGIGDLTRQQSSEPSCTTFSQRRHAEKPPRRTPLLLERASLRRCRSQTPRPRSRTRLSATRTLAWPHCYLKFTLLTCFQRILSSGKQCRDLPCVGCTNRTFSVF